MFWRKKRNATPAKTEQLQDYHAVAVTDTGHARAQNEDTIRFVRPADPAVRQNMGFLSIVADGMGGHASGEVASSLAVDVILEEYYRHHKNPRKALKKAFEKANIAIWNIATANKKLKNMGTTCTAVALINGSIYVSHIGDSRAYLYKKGELIQLSEDHTYVQTLLNKGEITPLEAENHSDKNILTKSLGTSKKRTCDLFLSEHPFEKGDKILLCSDGLYDYFSHQKLAEYLSGNNLNDISQQLTSFVLNRGAHDNFSLLLLQDKKEKQKLNVPTRAITVLQ